VVAGAGLARRTPEPADLVEEPDRIDEQLELVSSLPSLLVSSIAVRTVAVESAVETPNIIEEIA
jgi:hypothetical protein